MPTLVVSYSAVLGGAERLLVDFSGAIDGDVCVACPEGPLAEHARGAGLAMRPIASHGLDARGSLRARARATGALAAHSREIAGAIAEIRPHAVVGWSMRSALACAAALGPGDRRPAFVFQHNDLLPPGPNAHAVRLAARRADRVICLSYAIARDLDPRGTLGNRLRVVHPGVDLDAFDGAGPPANGADVLMLAALVDWKRPRLALDAVACAAAGDLPDVRLTLAGEPLDARGRTLADELEARARRLGIADRVTFAGRVENSAAALAQSSCLLHCADREPFGLALVEALASARPVVAPRSAGPLEIVDETAGHRYEPGSAQGAARGLVEVLSAPSRTAELGAAARRRAELRFDRADAHARYRKALPNGALG